VIFIFSLAVIKYDAISQEALLTDPKMAVAATGKLTAYSCFGCTVTVLSIAISLLAFCISVNLENKRKLESYVQELQQ
jgi:hypothetical protein